MPPGRTLRTLAGLGWRGWRDIARASLELGLARIYSGTARSRRNMQGQMLSRGSSAPPAPGQIELVERIAFTVPRVAARLPWRADCLVQALAAQRWLDRHGVASKLMIGVRKDQPSAIDAHAWLLVGDRVVTGGDVAAFKPLTP